MFEYFDDAIFLACNAFTAFAIYMFLNGLFHVSNHQDTLTAVKYFLYYVLSSIPYFIFHSQSINFLLNLLFLFLLTLSYRASWLARMTALLSITAFAAIVEIIFYVLLKIVKHPDLLTSAFIRLVSSFLLFWSLQLINRSMIQQDLKRRPFTRWGLMIIFPVISIYFALILFNPRLQTDFTILILLIGMLILNVLIVVLYDEMEKYYQHEKEHQLLVLQNRSYQKQYEMIIQTQEQFKLLRHDMKNHISLLRSYLSEGEYENAVSYLDQMGALVSVDYKASRTGNFVIDSILNYKAETAEKFGIAFKLDLDIPPDIPVDSVDLTAVLGNLLDNAMEAVKDLKEGKEIKCSIRLRKGYLSIEMENPYQEGTDQERKDPKEHGLGLISVKRIVDKYNGIMKIQKEQNDYIIKLGLYL